MQFLMVFADCQGTFFKKHLDRGAGQNPATFPGKEKSALSGRDGVYHEIDIPPAAARAALYVEGGKRGRESAF